MIIVALAASMAALPPVVDACAVAVRANSPTTQQVCVLPEAERQIGGAGLAPACRKVLIDGDRWRRDIASLADVPKLQKSLVTSFDKLVDACATDTANPPAPQPRATAQRLWD